MKRISEGVLRTKTKHAGRIPRDAPEKYSEVAQFARGMSCTAQSSMDSDCQSIWLARKQDVFNPGCCWLQCCWFHQICIMLSIQDSTLEHRSMKSHCSLAPLLWMELFVRKSLNSGFNLCRFSIVGGYMELNPTSCIVKLERGATSWPVGGFSLSLCLLSLWREQEQMFIDLGRWSAWFYQEMGKVVMWRLLQLLAGDSGSEHQVFSIKMCQRAFDLDLTLMSPLGTLRRCSPQVVGQHEGFEDKQRRRGKKCLERVGQGKTWETETIRRVKQNSRKSCNIEKKRKTEAEREREEEWSWDK